MPAISLVPSFRSPNILGALHVSHKNFRNPNESIMINISTIANKLGKHLPLAVVLQNKVRIQTLRRCFCLWLISISIWSDPDRFLWFLDNLLWMRHLLLRLDMSRGGGGGLPFLWGAALPPFTAALPPIGRGAALAGLVPPSVQTYLYLPALCS